MAMFVGLMSLALAAPGSSKPSESDSQPAEPTPPKKVPDPKLTSDGAPSDESKQTAGGSNKKSQRLHDAIDSNDLSVIQTLLSEENTDPNSRYGSDGRQLEDYKEDEEDPYLPPTALMVASSLNRAEIVKMLLNAGADKDLKTNSGQIRGQTVLMRASQAGYSPIVEMLLDAGADKDLQDNMGTTAIILASSNGRTEIVKLLHGAGADIDLKDNDGQTALHAACRYHNQYIVKILIDVGADKDLQNKHGWTAMHWASQGGDEEIIRMLIDAGADKDLQTTHRFKSHVAGSTALIIAVGEGIAADRGQLEIVKMLLDAGANTDLQNNDEQTALAICASASRWNAVNSKIVGMLLHAGANIRESELLLASQNAHSELVEMLQKAGDKKTVET